MIFKPLLIALQFLTRIPLPSPARIEPRDVGRSMLFYPLVGLMIGALLLGIDQLLQGVAPLLRAAMVVSAWVTITGGLHLDGLADMADAWVGGHGDRERTLAIMKDPYCGPMGVMALLLLILLKVAALVQLADHAPYLLVAAPLLGRTSLLVLFLTTPYVRPGGLGETLSKELPRAGAWTVVAGLLSGLAVVPGLPAGVLLATAGLFLLFRYMLMARLGGTTGDTAGALLEACEVVVLIYAALM